MGASHARLFANEGARVVLTDMISDDLAPEREVLGYASKANHSIQHWNIFYHIYVSPMVVINRQNNGYDIVYNWFDHLKTKGHYINGYVIMPNHVHSLISFIDTKQSINTIIGNGKRFMAYEIIGRLKTNKETRLLGQLASNVEAARKQDKKQHEMWELSFD